MMRSRLVIDQGTNVYGDYRWDRWKTNAIADGVAEDLAATGRAVMREAYQHAWSGVLCIELGYYDNGERMIRCALEEPEASQERWSWLLETDGERYRWRDDGTQVPCVPDEAPIPVKLKTDVPGVPYCAECRAYGHTCIADVDVGGVVRRVFVLGDGNVSFHIVGEDAGDVDQVDDGTTR